MSKGFLPHDKLKTPLITLLFSAAFIVAAGAAGAQERSFHSLNFAYTDCCGAVYGICQNSMTMPQAIHSLTMYFASHGYATVIREQISHFIKADVYNGKTYVDTVILDMKTGKIRSIY